MLKLCENNVEELRVYFAVLIKERCALEPEDLTDHALAKRSDEAVIWLTHRCAYGTIKRISFAVGHQHLMDTYERALSNNASSTAVGLVDLQIKLEHFASLPDFEIKRMRDKIVGNLFAYSVLRQMMGCIEQA